MYVANKDSRKKNNKLSKVFCEKTIICTKNIIFLKKLILKKNQPYNNFLFCINKFANLIKFLDKSFLLNKN